MASPFSVFRKNQKVMLAVLTLLAMFGFVFLPIIIDRMGDHSAANPVVVTTSKYGKLHEYELSNLCRHRQRILGILTDLRQMAGDSPAMARQRAENLFGPPTEQSAVEGWLLAQHASELGMVVTDPTVNAFLKRWTRDSVKAADIQKTLKRAQLTELQFFSLMKPELMAVQLREMFSVSLAGLTPAERWEYFLRIKQSATIEAAVLPVENYLDRIDEPSEAELIAFFKEYKDQPPMPDSPEPGFREPQQVALEYFKIPVDKFATPEVISDEEVQQHYEKNKELYDPPKKESDKAPAQGDTEKETKPTEEQAPPQTTDTEPASENKPDQSDQKEEPQAEKDQKETSALNPPSPFRLTSLLQEPAEAKPTEQQPAQPAPEKPTEEQPTQPTQENLAGEQKTQSAQEKPAEEQSGQGTEEKPAEGTSGLAEATKQRIRRELAYQRIEKIISRLREEMDAYRSQWSKYEVALIQRRGKNQTDLPPAPPRPDFQQMAKPDGLSVGNLALSPQWQVQGSDIGKSLVGGREPVWFYAFQSMAKFRPEVSTDLQGDVYLFWKTDETRDRIPKFDDPGVRDRVLRAWKLIRARDLALQAAEKIAEECRQANKFLSQVLAERPDVHVIQPPPFTWMTFGNVPLGSAPSAIRTSDVEGVAFAGDEFMRKVFQLEPGQIGTALNAPKDTAYVIRLTELSPSREVLWKQFEVDDFSKYAPAGGEDRRQIYRAWLEDIKRSAGYQLAPGRKLDRPPEEPPADAKDAS